MPLRLRTLDSSFAICRLDPGDPTPEWARGELVSVTRTANELSILCDEAAVPAGVRAERGWRAFVVEGPLPFDMVGVAASLTSPLAAAGISILILSTFDTDVLLVKDDTLEAAAAALRGAGFDLL